MRGKGYTTAAESEENRITPAYAGKSSHLCKSFRDRQDHPRLCGEKPIGSLVQTAFTGSPPPMRGKESAYMPQSYQARITPAYAGKRFTIEGR